MGSPLSKFIPLWHVTIMLTYPVVSLSCHVACLISVVQTHNNYIRSAYFDISMNLFMEHTGHILILILTLYLQGKGSQHTYWLVSRESTEPRGSTASETSGPVHLVAEQMSLPESVVSE